MDFRNKRYHIKYKIEQSINEIKNMQKKPWKSIVPNKIINKLNKNFMRYVSNNTELLFSKENKISKKNYISRLNPKLLKTIMPLSLNKLENKEK